MSPQATPPLQAGNILKKGKWGFYNKPSENLESVYEAFINSNLDISLNRNTNFFD